MFEVPFVLAVLLARILLPAHEMMALIGPLSSILATGLHKPIPLLKNWQG
jgi:hypothetical protein